MNLRTYAELWIKQFLVKLKKSCSHWQINQEDQAFHFKIFSKFLSEVSIINIQSNNCSGLFETKIFENRISFCSLL